MGSMKTPLLINEDRSTTTQVRRADADGPDALRTSILKPGVGEVVSENSPRLSFADQAGHALEDVSTIPARRARGGYASGEEEDCMGCNSRLKWLALPLLALAVVVFMAKVSSGSPHDGPHHPAEPAGSQADWDWESAQGVS